MLKLRILLSILATAALTLVVGRAWPMVKLWITASFFAAVFQFGRALVAYFAWRMTYRRRLLMEVSHENGAT